MAKKLLKERGKTHVGKAELVVESLGGNKRIWGLSIDGDGSPQYPFGCPRIIWTIEEIESEA